MVYQKLSNFLEKHRKGESKVHTHTIYSDTSNLKGSYNITPEKLDEFYGLVHKSLFKKNDTYTLVEKIQPICPFIVDLDLKFKDELEERQYNKPILEKIIDDIFAKMNEVYTMSDDQKVCWIMEKDKIRKIKGKDYKSKDGIHILFPHIIADKKAHRILRNSMVESDYHEYFKEEGKVPPMNTMDEIVDECIYKSGNWMIYGCGKPNDESIYKLTTIYKLSSSGLLNLPIDGYIEEPLEIINFNSVSKHTQITVEYTEEINDRLKNKPLKNSKSMENIDILEIHPAVINASQKHDIQSAKKLTMILSTQRASDYSDWKDVGFCLHTISKDLLPTWIAFSKKWSMWTDSSECERQWGWFNQNNNRKITVGSLHYWAKQDSFEAYQEIKKESLENYLRMSIKGDKATGPHADVANVIFHYFKDCFVCADLKENLWYHFNEHHGGKWEPTELGHKLRSKLSNEIVDLYMYWQVKYQQLANQEEEDSEMHGILNNRVTNCSKVIIKLKDSSYKDKIMKECRELFYDEKFKEKLDDQRNLFGFENGIYDLSKCIFRGGLPSDYVSLSCGITMPVVKTSLPVGLSEIMEMLQEMTDYDELNDGLNDFLIKVFPNDRVRNYILRFLSSCLSGEVREEKFYFWTGSGGNGKSKLVDLVEFALGEYSKSMDVSYLTTKKGSSSSASPELENIKKARFVWMSEPEKHDTIYGGKLKLMTGGDTMTSRGLFKGTEEFKPQFKIILMCNDLPKLSGNDGGIWRRLEVVQYISKFTDDPRPSPSNPNQYLADEQLDKKLESWKIIFIVKLLATYKLYDKEGTKPPPEVKKQTKSYRTSNDIVANWVDDDLEECDDFCSFEELFDAWERWCDDEGYREKQRPEKKEIKEALCKLQEKTEYGLVLGKNKGDGCANGTKRLPKFNFKPTEE
jgi:P4 family phage/plasmid primase-like protien